MVAEPHFAWQYPKYSPEELISAYVGLVSAIPGVLRGWAAVAGNKLHFDTEIAEQPETERRLYEAELALMDRFGPELFSFDVYRVTAVPKDLGETARLVLTA